MKVHDLLADGLNAGAFHVQVKNLFCYGDSIMQEMEFVRLRSKVEMASRYFFSTFQMPSGEGRSTNTRKQKKIKLG